MSKNPNTKTTTQTRFQGDQLNFGVQQAVTTYAPGTVENLRRELDLTLTSKAQQHRILIETSNIQRMNESMLLYQKQISDQNQKIQQLQEDSQRQNVQVQAIQTQMTSHEQKLSSIEQKLQAGNEVVNTQLHEVNTRFSTLEDKIDTNFQLLFDRMVNTKTGNVKRPRLNTTNSEEEQKETQDEETEDQTMDFQDGDL